MKDEKATQEELLLLLDEIWEDKKSAEYDLLKDKIAENYYNSKNHLINSVNLRIRSLTQYVGKMGEPINITPRHIDCARINDFLITNKKWDGEHIRNNYILSTNESKWDRLIYKKFLKEGVEKGLFKKETAKYYMSMVTYQFNHS